MRVRVVLADERERVRAGLRMVVDATPDIEVVGEAGTGAQAVRLVRELHPDVVAMDLRMPGMDGVTWQHPQPTRHPDTDPSGRGHLGGSTLAHCGVPVDPVDPAGRDGGAEAVAVATVEIRVPQRGQTGDVLVQEVVLSMVGGQCPQSDDGSAQAAGGPQKRGAQDQAERAELVFQTLAVSQQVEGLGDPPVPGERGAQRGGAFLAAEHPQQVVGPHLPGDQGAGHPQYAPASA